jgi:hypothetical protein
MATSEQNIHGFDSAGVFFSECWILSVGYYVLRATDTVIHEFTLKILYYTRVFSDNITPNNTNKMWAPIYFSSDFIFISSSRGEGRFTVEYSFHRNVFRLLELEMCLMHVSNTYLYLSDA